MSRLIAVVALLASMASCSSSSDESETTSPPTTATSDSASVDTEPADTEPADTEPTETNEPDDSVAGGAAPPAGLLAAIEEVTSDPEYAHANFGFAVLDQATGDVLFEQNGDKLFVTGSILKSFPTSTLLAKWGPDYRFRTPVYRTGPVDSGVLSGDLVLVASGDMSMGLREQPDGTLIFDDAPNFDHTYANNGLDAAPVDGDPMTGLDSLAEQVASAGITSVAGDVVIDDRLFDTFSGWPFLQVSPASPIIINDNRIDVTITAAAAGELATVDYRPQTAAYTVRSEVQTAAAGEDTTVIVRLAEPGVFVATGQIAADAEPAFKTGDIADPAGFARTAFIEALVRAGVQVTAAPVGPNPRDTLPAEGSYSADTLLGEHVSAELSEFTKVVLKTSQNPGADLMACLNAVAAGSKDCPAGLTAESEYAASLGLPNDALYILDGAGANGYVTPLGMARFYEALLSQPIADAYRQSLAVVGVDGDLATEATDSPAAGRIVGKTGTRGEPTPSGVGILYARTLVGYAEAASGRPIVMAVFIGGGVKFESIDDLRSIVEDHTALVVAVQQAF